MDSNTPKQHLPKLHPGQRDIYNTGGFDKLLMFPAGPYDVELGEATPIGLNSDHDLIVVPVTLLLDGTVVTRFRFGTANIRHDMTKPQKRADLEKVRAHCDVVVWQEIDTPEANALIDEALDPADFYHLFADLEDDMTIDRRLFKLITKAQLPKGIVKRYAADKISSGVEHVTPHRYDVWAIVVPISQT